MTTFRPKFGGGAVDSLGIAGQNGGMTGRALLLRMALVGVLAVGLIGMHHLVVAACHHGSSASVSAHVSAHPDPASLPAASEPVTPIAMGVGQPVTPVDQEPMLQAALTCLAVLGLLVLLVPGVMRRVRWALPRISVLTYVRQRVGRFLDPPDLAELSILRT